MSGPPVMARTIAAARPGAAARLVAAAGLAALAAVPYVPLVAGGDFIHFDDPAYVTANPVVAQGLTGDGLRWAFTTFHAGNWHPLTWISHMLDASLFGLDARGHHLTSVLLHALSTAVLFVALARLTGRTGAAAFVASLFGVHPLHVESVAWVAERKDVLSGLLFTLVLLSHAGAVRRPAGWRHLRTAGLLALGLMAKPMLVTTPFVLLLLDFWPLGRLPLPLAGRGRATLRAVGRLLLEKVPLLALCAGSAALTLAAQRAGGAVGDVAAFPFSVRVVNAVTSFAAYLGKAVLPSSLAVYYPHPMTLPPLGEISGALALLALLSALAVSGVRRRPWLLAGWCWYLGMLVPVVGIVQVGGQAMADRYTYLPLIGLFIMAAWSFPVPSGARVRRPQAVTAAAAALVVVAFSTAAAVQAGLWRDSRTLFRQALAVTSDNWLVHNNLGALLADAGEFEEATPHFREALRIRADYADAHNNLGNALLALGEGTQAVEHLREARRLRPADPKVLTNLGAALVKTGQPGEAIECYRQALALGPASPETLNNLGNALATTGRVEEAIESYRRSLGLKPDNANALNNLGNALARVGRFDEAIGSYREALRVRPDFPEARRTLAILLMALGRQEPLPAARGGNGALTP